jgi:hypothetical protein
MECTHGAPVDFTKVCPWCLLVKVEIESLGKGPVVMNPMSPYEEYLVKKWSE